MNFCHFAGFYVDGVIKSDFSLSLLFRAFRCQFCAGVLCFLRISSVFRCAFEASEIFGDRKLHLTFKLSGEFLSKYAKPLGLKFYGVNMFAEIQPFCIFQKATFERFRRSEYLFIYFLKNKFALNTERFS